MKIYIASSWRNQHAVEMLTAMLRQAGHKVASFIEHNFGEGHGPDKKMDFDEWMYTMKAQKAFDFDTHNATQSHLVIYVGPSGTDAWAEVGAAWGCRASIYGLWAKGEPAGLMRKMVTWFKDYKELLEAVEKLKQEEYTLKPNA